MPVSLPGWMYLGSFADLVTAVRVMPSSATTNDNSHNAFCYPNITSCPLPPTTTIPACQAWGAAGGFNFIGLQNNGEVRVIRLARFRPPTALSSDNDRVPPVLRLSWLLPNGVRAGGVLQPAGVSERESGLHGCCVAAFAHSATPARPANAQSATALPATA